MLLEMETVEEVELLRLLTGWASIAKGDRAKKTEASHWMAGKKMVPIAELRRPGGGVSFWK